MESKQKYLPYLIVVVASMLLIHNRLGLSSINPSNLHWLMSHGSDWCIHYLGWAFFKDLSWGFPLGKLDEYYYPFVSSIGYTDSIPLLAIPFKVLSPILPEDFQYFGLWLLACYILQGVYGIKWLKNIGVQNLTYLTFCGIFFVAAPILEFRLMHPALCAHWLIIASFYNYTRDASARSITIFQLILLFLSAMIHPYMTFIVLALSAGVMLKIWFFDEDRNWPGLLLSFILMGISIVIPWYATGFFTLNIGTTSTSQFGLFCANLNTFFNPTVFFGAETSRFLPELPVLKMEEYEGFGYLGLGMIILLFLRLILWFTKPKMGKILPHLPMILAVLILLLISFSDQWRINSTVLFDLNIGGFVGKILGTFQSSGRFLWPFYYCLFAWVLSGFYKREILQFKWLNLILGCFLVLQIIDLSPNFPDRPPHYNIETPRYVSPIDIETIAPLCEQAKRIVTIPSYRSDIEGWHDYKHWLYIAQKFDIPITAGFYARIDYTKVDENRQEILKALSAQEYDVSEIIFVVKDDFGHLFQPYLENGKLNGAEISGYNVLWDSQMKDAPESNPASLFK